MLLFYSAGFVIFALITFTFKVIFMLYHPEVSSALSWPRTFSALAGGVYFDFAVAALLSIPGIVAVWLGLRIKTLKLGAWLVYTIATVFLVSFQISDAIFYADTGRHLGFEINNAEMDLSSVLSMAISQHFVLCMSGIVLIGLSSGLWLLLTTRLPGLSAIHHRIGKPELSLTLLILLSLILVRGGIHHNHTQEPKSALIATNGTFNALYYLLQPSQASIQPLALPALTDEEIRTHLKHLYPETSHTPSGSHHPKPMNIVMIFLESWPSAYMRSYGFDKLVTPYFDQLRSQSLTATEMIAGGHRTTEGLFSALCSFQNPLGTSIARTHLENNSYHCLPQILRNHGWSTAFFQGSQANTAGTGPFAQKLGFEKSFGKEDMPTGNFKHNHWGAQDPDLYDFILQTLDTLPKPFLVGINTNSTHDSVLPEKVESPFGMGAEWRLSVLHFGDKALQRFMGEYQARSDFQNTIFVLVSDHTAGITGSNLQQYRIPFLIYGPRTIPPRTIQRAVSQRDITPTVLDIVGVESKHWFSGKSLLREDQGPYFADYYHPGILGWIEGERLTEIDIASPESLRCYRWKDDFELQHLVPCDDQDQLLKKRALAFTTRSQNLLFKGEVSRWNQPH